jgi:hypothetical protein
MAGYHNGQGIPLHDFDLWSHTHKGIQQTHLEGRRRERKIAQAVDMQEVGKRMERSNKVSSLK